MARNRRRGRYKFTEKKHSKRGIAALIIAILMIVTFFVFISMAFKENGTLSTYFGSAGVFAMLFSVVSFIMAVGSLKEETSFPLFPRLSTFVSLLAMGCWVGIYISGFLLQ